MTERDLTGRCGTCGFFIRLRTDDAGRGEGECRLGCWPPPLKDTATCPHHKPVGASWDDALKRRRFVIYPGKVGEAETFRGWNRFFVGQDRVYKGGFHIPSLSSRASAPEGRHLLHAMIVRWLRADEARA